MKAQDYIKRKLQNNILPYLISGDELKGTTNYYLYHTYYHSKEAVTLASGMGLANPFFNLINGQPIAIEGFGIWGIGGVLGIGLLRYFGGREDLAKKILSQKNIRNQLKALRYSLMQALEGSNAEEVLKSISEIQQKISLVINTAIQEETWPYNLYSLTASEKAKIETERILNALSSDWSKVEAIADTCVPDQIIS